MKINEITTLSIALIFISGVVIMEGHPLIALLVLFFATIFILGQEGL